MVIKYKSHSNIIMTIHNIIPSKAKVLMLIGQRRDYFCLNQFCFVKRAKLLAYDWSSGCLATAYSIVKLFFCNNGVSFRGSQRGIWRIIKGQEWKWKHEEQHGAVRERFQKVGEWKKLASKFRRVRERCPRPTNVAVLSIQKFSKGKGKERNFI